MTIITYYSCDLIRPEYLNSSNVIMLPTSLKLCTPSTGFLSVENYNKSALCRFIPLPQNPCLIFIPENVLLPFCPEAYP